MKRSLSDKKGDAPDSATDRHHKSVKWDEANLEENDKLKAELNPKKIDEPKTPYHGPMDSDEELSIGEAGMAPLTLEDDAVQQLVSEQNGGTTSAASSREDERPCSHNGWSDSDRGEYSSSAISNSHSSGCQGEECESNPEAHKRHQEKRQRFEARRKQHYNMKDALKRGKQLLSQEPDPGEVNQKVSR